MTTKLDGLDTILPLLVALAPFIRLRVLAFDGLAIAAEASSNAHSILWDTGHAARNPAVWLRSSTFCGLPLQTGAVAGPAGGSGSQSAASRSTLLGGFWVRAALYFGPMRVPVVAVQPGFALCVYRPFCCPCVVRSNCHGSWVQL